MRFKSGRNAW